MNDDTNKPMGPAPWEIVLRDISKERARQIEEEHRTPDGDDADQKLGELAVAAACYACVDARIPNDWVRERRNNFITAVWPWAHSWWKPKDKRRNLIRAGALIVAEIERLDRAAAPAASIPSGE